MRIAVHRPSIAPGSRLELAVVGLGERGHRLCFEGRATTGSRLAGANAYEELPSRWARPDADVVLGGSRPFACGVSGARTRARALVLSLTAAERQRWGALDAWAWAVTGGYGLIDEREADRFLARTPEPERERLALWPAGSDASPTSVYRDTDFVERACERALARRSAGPGRAAVFVDRDGTLIAERHHLADPNAVELLPGVAEALRTARLLGHPVVVISNQAGVGRGLFTEARMHEVFARLRNLLRAEGVELDSVRVCPHAPEAGCACRKPGTLLLREAAEDLRLSLPDSVMIGDKWIDVEAGQAVRAAGVLVRTGHGAVEAIAAHAVAADRVGADLPEAVRWFLSRPA